MLNCAYWSVKVRIILLVYLIPVPSTDRGLHFSIIKNIDLNSRLGLSNIRQKPCNSNMSMCAVKNNIVNPHRIDNDCS